MKSEIMSRQIALPIDAIVNGEIGRLIITNCNEFIVRRIDQIFQKSSGQLLLSGAGRSGKSTMLKYAATLGDAVIIDDAQNSGEEFLFAQWNLAREKNIPLIFASQRPAFEWQMTLPDLKSRIGSMDWVEIAPPDDEMVENLLQKHLNDRGATIYDEASAYLIKRIERSYMAVEQCAIEINRLALEQKSPITLPLVRQIY
ncbi:hypothetical protein LPB140_08645 [Sphingorhabdus lutea]|uniref:Hda lid domain-containing protein n=1 Tax=Sphingorhabdus lutea TaxID=1913578 RepID=A0A1L3JCJ2_9SPHN|nr:DnaA/Hda family protein [Sphingorhabdus lutea]APG62848.1 hypothetical protein LPB140_08645 [Sphingorhabdus lutea]